MKIKELQIQNFKSIRDLVLKNPSPFSVFVGPNGAGKSNIFEALEFTILLSGSPPSDVLSFYDRLSDVLHTQHFKFTCDFGSFPSTCILDKYDLLTGSIIDSVDVENFLDPANASPQFKIFVDYRKYPEYQQFFRNHSRLFLNHPEIKRSVRNDSRQLSSDASNLEKVLERILENEDSKEELLSRMQIFVPEFENLKIESSHLDGKKSFVVYEKKSDKPFPRRLISDGTKNILALLTAVLQSDEPQFLCIEEPENGLHPYAIEGLVTFFRNACKDKGHFIWLNTHSQTLVRQLAPEEIIVVDKKDAATSVKQFQGEDFFGLQMDDAWLTNALGGGLP